MNQRMKWDAEAAFKRIEGQELERREDGNTVPDAVWFDKQAMKAPYTPSPNVAAWLKAQADKPKGRDYDAILRAAKKAPVGYYEDAPTGIKFGGQPLPSVGHGKDVDTAEGGTPLIGMFGQERLWFGGMEYLAHGRAMPCRRDAAMCWWQNTRTPTIPEMCSWLEQNGHADVAAQLRGTPRDGVATGGGRVWRSTRNAYMWTRIGTTWYSYSAVRGAWDLYGVDYLRDDDMCGVWQELFGPERDAIIAECRKAMGL